VGKGLAAGRAQPGGEPFRFGLMASPLPIFTWRVSGRAVAVDILSGVSGDWLRSLTWISALVSGVLLWLWRPRRPHLAALGSANVFGVANIGAGIYVLSHLGDDRWAVAQRTDSALLRCLIPLLLGSFWDPLTRSEVSLMKSSVTLATRFGVRAGGWPRESER
jgi:hypothetical protein